MKTLPLFPTTLFLICLNTAIAQTTPPIQWQKCLGGSLQDLPSKMTPTNDGGYIAIGETYSIDGDVTGHGNPLISDVWVVKLSSAGVIEWENAYGGFNYETGFAIRQTTDGGYIFCAYTRSNDVYVTGNHGGNDYWIVKLNSTGGIMWEECLGGPQNEFATAIIQTTDGGFVVCGNTYGAGGQVSSYHGGYSNAWSDAWIVKLSSAGVIQWEKSYGGLYTDYASDIVELPDGNYVFAGESYSTDGDLTSNYGSSDAWFTKINSSNGAVIWSYSYGGSGKEEIASMALTQDANVSLVAAGSTDSPNDYNVTGNHGGKDFWLITLDGTNGIFNFAKCFGGSEEDKARSVDLTYDQGYFVTGEAWSSDGDVTNINGGSEIWTVKINHGGTIDWSRSLGTPNNDQGYSGAEAGDGGYFVLGYAVNNGGDVSGNHGGGDFWVAKLDPCFTPPASTALITPSTPACGGMVTMSVPGGIPYNYQWKKNGDNVAGATTRIYSATKNGNYTCEVSNGMCGTINSSNTIKNKKQEATINPSGTVNKCAGEVVNFSANTGANLTYQWYKGSSALAGATNATYSTTKTGKFKVTVYNTQTQCSETSAKTTVNNVCREENKVAEEFTVTAFPNPAGNEIQITISNAEIQNLLLMIYDLNGKLIAQFPAADFANGNSITINTTDWNSGMYFCNLVSLENQTIKSIKFIVQH